jgi:hypothetical protein
MQTVAAMRVGLKALIEREEAVSDSEPGPQCL